MKKYLSVLLILSMILSISFTSFADTDKVDEEIITKVILQVGDKAYELSPQNYKKEAQKILKEIDTEDKMDFENVKIERGMTDDWARYDEDSTGTDTRYDLQTIWSNIAYNPTNNENDYSVSCSKTFGWNIEASGEYELSVIQTGMSINWNSSESYDDNLTVTISPYKYGWIEIAPIMDYSEGVYKVFSWLAVLKSSTDITLWVPRTSNPKYLYIFKESSTNPI